MIIAMRILQKLVVSTDLVGQALVPYYRQVRQAPVITRELAKALHTVLTSDVAGHCCHIL